MWLLSGLLAGFADYLFGVAVEFEDADGVAGGEVAGFEFVVEVE